MKLQVTHKVWSIKDYIFAEFLYTVGHLHVPNTWHFAQEYSNSIPQVCFILKGIQKIYG